MIALLCFGEGDRDFDSGASGWRPKGERLGDLFGEGLGDRLDGRGGGGAPVGLGGLDGSDKVIIMITIITQVLLNYTFELHILVLIVICVSVMPLIYQVRRTSGKLETKLNMDPQVWGRKW